MTEFAAEMGFRYHHITPEWPRTNGSVERINRTLVNAIRSGHVEGKSVRDSVVDFLAMYRATPHTITGKSPYAAMYGGREMRVKLSLASAVHSAVPPVIYPVRVAEKKQKMVDAANGKKRQFRHVIRVGDTVLMRARKVNKLSTPFQATRLQVTGVKGSMVTAQRTDGSTVTRNVSFFKKVPGQCQTEQYGTRESGGRTVYPDREWRYTSGSREYGDSSDEDSQRNRTFKRFSLS